jgi:hypothetical protein
MRKLIMLISIGMVLVSLATGCAQKPKTPGAKIVAVINSYELTAEDFADEARLTAANKYLDADPVKAKQEMLDEIITKKVLLQEAQRQDFDKDRRFMKEIERYWEQALIKLMVRKKMDELSARISVDPQEVRDEYDRLSRESGGKIGPFESMAPIIRDRIYNDKMQRLFGEWLEKLRAGSDIKIHKENL